jgi:NADPH:quinone reductase
MPTLMKALVLEQFGADFAMREIARPVPSAGEVRIKIAASGVNPLDTKIRVGAAGHANVRLPAVLGIDLAGTIDQVGDGVSGFAVGDEVYGMTGGVGPHQGSLAEYAAVDANLIARVPSTLSMIQAAALPLAVITAWESLVDRANVHENQTVLVHGGAGGVGHVAIQVARARGATVFATGRPEQAETIRNFGAEPIDFTTTRTDEYVQALTGGEGFDVVLDTVGGMVLDAAFTAVRRHTGHVVSILGWGTHSLAPLSFRGATYSGVFTLLPLLTGTGRAHHGEILASATAMVEAGQLTPLVAPVTYTWESVMQAHEAVDAGNPGGKVVIDIAPAQGKA